MSRPTRTGRRFQPERPPKKPIHLWLPIDLYEKIQLQRRAEGRSLTEWVRRALESRVELPARFAGLSPPPR